MNLPWFANHPHWDELAKLIEYDRIVLGWFRLFLHIGFLGRKPAQANHFFNFLDHPYGMPVHVNRSLVSRVANYNLN